MRVNKLVVTVCLTASLDELGEEVTTGLELDLVLLLVIIVHYRDLRTQSFSDYRSLLEGGLVLPLQLVDLDPVLFQSVLVESDVVLDVLLSVFEVTGFALLHWH